MDQNEQSPQYRFLVLCLENKLEEMQQLYRLNRNDIDINAENGYALLISCRCGYIEIAKWLYSLGADIHAARDCAFRWSCEFGKIEIAKWLHSLGGVDIHAVRDYAFDVSCHNRHLEVVKWLLDISNDKSYSLGGIDIHVNEDRAIKWSCYYNHIDMVRFLLESEDWSKSHFCVRSGPYNNYNYISTDNDILAKLLFDHEIRLKDEQMEKCVKMRESIIGTVTNHLIVDLANIVYSYV
jgi:ankyrin repeat protein